MNHELSFMYCGGMRCRDNLWHQNTQTDSSLEVKMKTNVEIAKEFGCTARQISKSRKCGSIMVRRTFVMTDEDGRPLLDDEGNERTETKTVREKYTAPAPHVDPRNYLVQRQERERRAREAAAQAAAAQAASDEAMQASLAAD